jgi:hypothetical protein
MTDGREEYEGADGLLKGIEVPIFLKCTEQFV